jgi:flavin reductase (DIM6/NTAB) family NADH-FMN oxidoreductase RutF
MNVDPKTMRDTLRFWSSGVSIVSTTDSGKGERDQQLRYAGMTVSAFNSLSLEPPLILICLTKETTTANLILESRIFSVSMLGGDQAYLSDRFAGRIPLPNHEDRFDGVAIFTAETGAPMLQDALAWLDCRVQTIHDGSTHWIVIGEVVATGYKDETLPPLIYFNRAYYALAPEHERP